MDMNQDQSVVSNAHDQTSSDQGDQEVKPERVLTKAMIWQAELDHMPQGGPTRKEYLMDM